jgi:hypothetical protein
MKFTVLCLLLVVAGVAANTAAHAQFAVPWRHAPTLAAISSAESDPRLGLVDEAVAFWNKTLEEIGSGFRLPPAVRTPSVMQTWSLSGGRAAAVSPDR